jgi:hypothetical protein
MKPVVATIALTAALLSGCTSYSGRGLVSGKSDAREVEALMGAPAERITLASGDSVWFYPQNPNGLHTFAARLNPQGILQQIDQRLTVENLAKLVPGQSTAAQVRELLGPPWQVTHMARQKRDAWHYRMEDGAMVRHDLYVQISADGLVREVIMLRDYVNDIGHDRD